MPLDRLGALSLPKRLRIVHSAYFASRATEGPPFSGDLKPRSVMKTLLPLFVRLCLAAATFFLASIARAQATTGTIEGRVIQRGGEFFEHARVTIEGTTLEAFTDTSGQYRIRNVPAGTVKLKVFFTGQTAQTDSVAVAAGQTVQHDFNLTAGQARSGVEIVKLDTFI